MGQVPGEPLNFGGDGLQPLWGRWRCWIERTVGPLIRIGFSSCRRFGVVTAPVFNIRVACVEALLQDRAFQLIEGFFVRGAGAPLVQGSGPDGSKLSSVAPAVLTPQEVNPDQGPLGPSEVSQLLAGYETRNFLTVRHVIRAPSLSPQDIPAGDCGPDAGVLQRLCA